MTRVRNILFITSTIAPASTTFLLKVASPAERLGHYKAALELYLKLLGEGVFDLVVYVDNSGYPLDEIREMVCVRGLEDRVELISYCSTVPPDNSRYFLEMNLIEIAMTNSAFIARNPEAVVWKVTGRYIVENARKIVESRPPSADIYVNCRDYPDRTLDFYFFGFVARTYRQHIGRDFSGFAGIATGEEIFRQQIDAGEFADLKIVRRFAHVPRLRGVRGFDGSKYGGTKDTIKYLARCAMNAVLPRVWI